MPLADASERTRALMRQRSALDIEKRADISEVPFIPIAQPGKQPKHYSNAERLKMSRYESVNTYEPQTTIYKDHLEYRSREPRWFIWVFVTAVGILTACATVLMVSCLHTLFAVRMRLLQYGLMGFSSAAIPPIYDNDIIAPTESSVFSGQDTHLFGLPERNLGGGFLMWILFSLLMSGGAALICGLVPDAVGAGSPEVLAYLNGVDNFSFSDPKVLVAKMIATMLTIASGVPLGFYGTLAQTGTMIATALLTRSKLVRFDAIRIICCFRNPRDKRIITVLGAASGFASAFSVSIGGLMLVMEQLSTIFPVRFALYVFVTCLVSSLSLETYFSYLSYFGDRDRSIFGAGELISEVLIQFDTRVRGITPVPMNVLVFIPAIFIGVVCGLLAVAFVRVHSFALNFRRRLEFVHNTKVFRYILPVILSLMYATAIFWLAAIFGGSMNTDGNYSCQAIAPDSTIMATRNISVVSYYGMSGMLCDPYVLNMSNNGAVVPQDLLPTLVAEGGSNNGSSNRGNYSAPPIIHTYSSIAFGFSDSTLQFLLSWRTPDLIPAGVLVLFGTVYFFFSAACSGIALCGDVMLPSLVLGGCVGRLVGLAVMHLFNSIGMSGETWTDPGAFALLGAGCFFGGVTGMTFSVCVILTEMSNDFRHVLPLMLGISIAKRVAERFSHNLNTTYLESRCVPMLDFDARIHKYDMFCAKHVMSPNVVTLETVSSIEHVVQTLRTCDHNAFPVASVRDGTYKGIILRQQLVLYLWHLFLTDSHAGMNYEQLQRVEDQLFYEEHDRDSQLPPFEDFWLQDRVDLSAHIDQSGFCVMDHTSLSRTYHLFRTLGLRHMVVVDKDNRIVGMITRKDLVSDTILQSITNENEERRRQLIEVRRQERQAGLRQDDSDEDEDSLGHTMSPTSASGVKSADGQPEWIVVDDAEEEDGPVWGGGGLGPMHPVMLTSGISGSGDQRHGSLVGTRFVSPAGSARDIGSSSSHNVNAKVAAILRQVPSTGSLDGNAGDASQQREGGDGETMPKRSPTTPNATVRGSTSATGIRFSFVDQTAPVSAGGRGKRHGSEGGKFTRVLRQASSRTTLDGESANNSFVTSNPPGVNSFAERGDPSTSSVHRRVQSHDASAPAAGSSRAILSEASHDVHHTRSVSNSSTDSVEILRRQQRGPFDSPRSAKSKRKVIVVSPLVGKDDATSEDVEKDQRSDQQQLPTATSGTSSTNDVLMTPLSPPTSKFDESH